MSGHTKWTELRDELCAKAGAEELMARAREQSAAEFRRDERGPADAPSEPELPRS